MFGWLASFGVPSRVRPMPSTRWLAMTPHALVHRLGQLGGVLYLAPRAEPCPVPHAMPPGCMVESADLAPLLATRFAGLTCAVTAEGPREWIDCAGVRGEILARIYLLPDTDYLAWDGLFVDASPCPVPSGDRFDRAWRRGAQARVLSFTHRHLAGFTLLGARAAPVSALGRGVARDIAVSESVAISV